MGTNSNQPFQLSPDQECEVGAVLEAFRATFNITDFAPPTLVEHGFADKLKIEIASSAQSFSREGRNGRDRPETRPSRPGSSVKDIAIEVFRGLDFVKSMPPATHDVTMKGFATNLQKNLPICRN